MVVIYNYYFKFLIIGNAILAFALIIYYALPPLTSAYINSQIALTPSSKSYPMWKDVPVPIYQKFYFFNVTNALDIEQRGHRPHLEEIGPFTYRTDWTKRDIESDDLLNTINFKHFKQWQFEPEMSIADHKLQLVTLNAPLAITLSLIQSAPNAVRLLVTFSLDGLSDGFFTKRSVKQLLFDGYPDLLTTFGPLLNAEMLSQGGHFGYMNARNNSLDGMYEINTGADDISKLNTINRYNGRTRLTYWNNHFGQCNSLEGASTGDMFPPIQRNQSSIKLFQPDFCRVWPLNYDSNLQQEGSGLRLKRFKASRDVFRNSSDLPENACFFSRRSNHSVSGTGADSSGQQDSPAPANGAAASAQQSAPTRPFGRRQQTQQQQRPNSNRDQPRHRIRHEWPAGVFTLAPCKFNAPIYISMPHFLDAEPYYNSQVDGLFPEPEKHEFYLDIEPRTGSPIQLNARVQLNVAISKPPGLVRFRNVPEIMFPVFWQELTVNVTGPVIDQLLLASRTEDATTNISYFFFLLGAIALLVAALLYLKSLQVQTFDQPALDSTNKS